MSDSNDSQQPGTRGTTSGTEQLRIVGAEEAGSLIGRSGGPGSERDGAGTDSPWAAPAGEAPRAVRRAVFESVPDAADDLPEVPLGRAERWVGGRGAVSSGDDITVLGVTPPNPGSSEPGEGGGHSIDADTGQHSQELELPHWTAPPTGQVPKVLADDSRKDESWSTYASAPRWQGEGSSGWDDTGADVSDLADEAASRADNQRPAIDQFFAFDELDDSEPTPERPEGRAARRGRDRDPERSADTGEHRMGPPVGSAGPAGRNVGVAAALGVGLAALALALFRMGPAPTMVFVLILLGIGGAEYFDASRRGGYRPATLLGLAAVVGLPAATYWRGEVAFPIIGGLVVVAGLLWFLFGVDQEQVTADLGVTLLGIGYVGGLGAFAALLLRAPGVDSTRVLLGAVVPVVASDVFAYVVGRNAGRTPLMAHVSPNKTVEGLLGGALGAVIASVVFNQLLGSNPWGGLGNSLALGLLVAVMAPLGDLAESLIKRDLGIKDMGTILPGHGGVLDRFDAMLFTLPGVFYLALLLDVLPN